MRIMSNIPALQSYNALTVTNNNLSKSIERLSTGLRINSAADDAAGLAISEKMRSQIRGLNQAVMNAQNGISMVQTAEGALGETHSMLQRMRELSVQAANDTLTQEDRGYIQTEIDQLKDEISRVATTTQFNKKKLLDGSAAVLWSASDLSTKAIIKGGLRQVDQFGQKAALEGNFKISVIATPGKAEVQKSDIFKIKHKNVIMNYTPNSSRGVTGVEVDNLPAGRYTVTQLAASSFTGGDLKTSQTYGITGGISALATDFTGGVDAASHDQNGSILLEVISVNSGANTVTFRAQANLLDVDGKVSSYNLDNLTVGTIGINDSASPTVFSALGLSLKAQALKINDYTNFHVGDKAVVNLTAAKGTAGIGVEAGIHAKDIWPDGWGDPAANSQISATYAVNDLKGKEVHFKNFYLNPDNGTVYQGNVIMTFDDKFDITPPGSDTSLATFEAAFIGQVAKSDVKLRDIDKFWDSNGRFLLVDPQDIMITQGDGTTTKITLYATDTMTDLRNKLNDAIAYGLGQSKYVVQASNNFVSFIEDPTLNTAESVAGTLVIRSLVPGSAGKISFSGDEDLIKAFSLNVIQPPVENTFRVSIFDAHTGKMTAASHKISGNMLVGVIHPNVDVIFDPMANIIAKWNDSTKAFDLSQDLIPYETILHLSDNTTVFQVGANEGEDMGLDIGDMSARALGISNVIVTDRESAARAITILDNAIGRVSSQRAKLGAYQNRLEHTISNLTTAATNTTAAESRIRDVDMAKEMMEFTKLNILSQAGTSMLAQANQLPQNVLALLRG